MVLLGQVMLLATSEGDARNISLHNLKPLSMSYKVICSISSHSLASKACKLLQVSKLCVVNLQAFKHY